MQPCNHEYNLWGICFLSVWVHLLVIITLNPEHVMNKHVAVYLLSINQYICYTFMYKSVVKSSTYSIIFLAAGISLLYRNVQGRACSTWGWYVYIYTLLHRLGILKVIHRGGISP